MMRHQAIELDASLAVMSARLGFEYGIPLTDSIILAASKSSKAVIRTQDAHFKSIPGVRYIEKR
jgi:hypothetical protein